MTPFEALYCYKLPQLDVLQFPARKKLEGGSVFEMKNVGYSIIKEKLQKGQHMMQYYARRGI